MRTLKEINETCEKATAAPWDWRTSVFAYKGENADYLCYPMDMGGFVDGRGANLMHFGDSAEWCPTEGDPPLEQDINFISHARTDLPLLLKWAQEARELIQNRMDACGWSPIENVIATMLLKELKP